MTDIEDSLLWEKLTETEAQETLNTAFKGVKELCFALKYSKVVEELGENALVSPNVNLAGAYATSPQDLALYNNENNYLMANDYPAYSGAGNYTISSNVGGAYVNQALAQESPETSLTEKINNSIESFVAVARCEDEACTKRILASCEEQQRARLEERKTSFACKADKLDKTLLATGNEAWLATMMREDALVATNSNRFDAALASTRAASLKMAGVVPDALKAWMKTKFTTINFSAPEKSDSFLVAAITASRQKIYLHLILHADLLEAEPLAEALLFLKPPENFSLDQVFSSLNAETEAPVTEAAPADVTPEPSPAPADLTPAEEPKQLQILP